MNKPEATDTLIPIRDFAKTFISQRGFAVSVQYIYKLISQHKAGTRDLDFEYKEIGKKIWIVKKQENKKSPG